MYRRTLLQAALVPLATGLTPRAVIAAYPTDAFLAREPAEAMREVFGTADIAPAPGDAIEIDAPHIASDPDLVTIRVRSGYPDTESITLLVAGNESPLAAHYRLYGEQSWVTSRLRLEQSTDLLVVVKAGGQLHTATRPVRVASSCRA